MTSNNQRVPPSYTYQEYTQLLRSLGHVKGAPGPVQNSTRRVNGQIDRQDDYTDYSAEQAEWTVDNMPEIMYALERPLGWLTLSDLHPPPKKTYQIYGEYLLDIPILPDHISSQLEGHRYETLCRFDPRIRFEELAKRMAPQFRPSSLLPDGRYRTSTGQMARNRFRDASNVLGWVSKGGNYAETKRNLEEKLRAIDINPSSTNSTRGITWGLIDPANGPNSARVPITGAHARETNSSVEVPTPADRQAANAQYAALRASLGLTVPAGIPGVQNVAATPPAPLWSPLATTPARSTSPANSYQISEDGDVFLDEVFDTGPRNAAFLGAEEEQASMEVECVRGTVCQEDCTICTVIDPIKCLFHYLEHTILPTPYTGRQ